MVGLVELSPECTYNSCMTLKEFFELNPKIAVAFSGGVDSAFLLSEAVKAGAAYAEAGDYVLLSPACASWGMFKNLEERGRIFKECVNAL